MSVTLAYVITGVIAYLLGSISTGILVAQKNHGPNLREVGSKNTGASNVLRTMGLKSGLIENERHPSWVSFVAIFLPVK